eukprot:sb/3469971/
MTARVQLGATFHISYRGQRGREKAKISDNVTQKRDRQNDSRAEVSRGMGLLLQSVRFFSLTLFSLYRSLSLYLSLSPSLSMCPCEIPDSVAPFSLFLSHNSFASHFTSRLTSPYGNTCSAFHMMVWFGLGRSSGTVNSHTAKSRRTARQHSAGSSFRNHHQIFCLSFHMMITVPIVDSQTSSDEPGRGSDRSKDRGRKRERERERERDIVRGEYW